MPVIVVWVEDQAEGAIANGTKIRKRNADPDDTVQNGSTGTVLGSLVYPGELPQHGLNVKHLYFIEWDEHADRPVGTIDHKIEEIT